MKAVYVPRGRWAGRLKALRRRWLPSTIGREGFFRGSLHAAFDVREVPYEAFARRISRIHQQCDVLFVNDDCKADELTNPPDFRLLEKNQHVPKVLMLENACAGDLVFNETVLDRFDLIFKRELFIDLDRYPVSTRIKDKLRTTMISCFLVDVPLRRIREFDIGEFGRRDVPADFDHDAFFVGKATSTLRRDALLKLRQEAAGLRILGGLSDSSNKVFDIPESLLSPRMSMGEYADAVHRTKVNLAIEGLGEFTYRHCEIWAMCAFMLCSPSLRELKLPLEAREGEHYVCYEDDDDLLSKVEYYCSHDDERNAIARAGRRMFERDYSFAGHGAYIRRSIEELVR